MSNSVKINWNEIKERALSFSNEWKDATREEAEAKQFLVEFFKVFGVYNRKVMSFEHRVKKFNDNDGKIDLFWPKTILVEMKSRGQDLSKAYEQAKEYVHGLEQNVLPRLILISDFENFHLYNLDYDASDIHFSSKPVEFQLKDFMLNVHHFRFLAGYEKKEYKEQDPVNIKAAELMGKLHDRLTEIGYSGHSLEVYLVRLLFCLFAEDTTIFNIQQFQDFIEQRTSEDGSDLAPKLQELFEVLNTADENRFTNLDEQLSEFPYVNGKLFAEHLPIASFDAKMRATLLDCCYLDWSNISPGIFGSMFQSIMNPKERRNLGAHYTSEKNILKLIRPLFLDDLYAEFARIKNKKNELGEFHEKLSNLKFLDPACGCGNFLVITYRELRLLEIEVLKALFKEKGQIILKNIDISSLIFIDVDQFYGIEIEEWPVRISEVAMWLMDHQMNMAVRSEFGFYFARLPLKNSAKIINGNALTVDWEDVVPSKDLSYILGNPPFIGKKEQNTEQKKQVLTEFVSIKNAGVLDYVACWYSKAMTVILKNPNVLAAFVSTNSIIHGEQVKPLWENILNNKLEIFFAHQTFKWTSEAKGKAAVHVVIVGFGVKRKSSRRLFIYQDISSEPDEIKVKNINPYLINASNLLLGNLSKPICQIPRLVEGITPLDNGLLSFKKSEYEEFIKKEPNSKKWFKKWVTGHSFINSYPLYCLWLSKISPSEIKKLPHLKKRINEVKEFRLQSKSSQKFADTPWLFRETSLPKNYILIPKSSSGKRDYLPIGFISDEIVSSSSLYLDSKDFFILGVLFSKMHIVWLKHIGGRIKSDYRYSAKLVYNNFPWPISPTDDQKKIIIEKTENILEARKEFADSSLADLYDSVTMPANLRKAHTELDKVVDKCYRPHPFISELGRIEFLFKLYETYTNPIASKEKSVKKRKA